MSFEKPFQIIRKAIKDLAEENATKESLEVPESRHFDDALKTYKKMRSTDPKGLELSVDIRAREQDIKNKMGKELYEVFDKVWIRVNQNSGKEFNEAIEKIKENKKMSLEDIEQAIAEFELSFIKGKAREVKNDPRIIKAFSGKEEILKSGIYSVMVSMLHVLRDDRENS